MRIVWAKMKRTARPLPPAARYLLLGAVLAAAFALWNGKTEGQIQMGMVITLFAVSAVLFAGLFKRRLGSRLLLFMILIAGWTMRIGYMLYTPYTLRGHDVGQINDFQNAAYTARLYLTGSLPSSYTGLFYHPPVSFALEAAVMHVYALFASGLSVDGLLEAAKLVPAFASCALLLVCLSLFRELGFSKRAILFAMSILAFQPTFYLLSASINNDMLTVFWMALALLYTVRWAKDRKMRTILLLAVFIGLAASTKLSGILVAAVPAVVFLRALFKSPGGRIKGLWVQYAAFLAVCAPLSLWYSVRNHLLFGQPFGYVLPMSTTGPLYIGMHSLAERFLSFPVGELFTSLFCNPYGDYHLWIYLVKCSLYGEFTFSSAAFLAPMLTALNLLLIALSLAAMVWVIFARDVPRLSRFVLGFLWLTQIGAFLVFNLEYPFGCTMDFRYIVPTLFSGAGFLGLAASKMRRCFPRAAAWAVPSLGVFTTAFAVFSMLFYLV